MPDSLHLASVAGYRLAWGEPPIQEAIPANPLAALAWYIRKGLNSLADSYEYDRLRRRYGLPSTFRFNGSGTLIYGDGEIAIGDETYIGQNGSIQLTKETTVRIGRKCAISHYFTVYTSNRIPDQDFSSGPPEYRRGDVTIGDNCVIGAHSVVTHDIPPNSVAAGNPCRVIRQKVTLPLD